MHTKVLNFAFHATVRACAILYCTLLTHCVKEIYILISRNVRGFVSSHAKCIRESKTTCPGVMLDIMTVMLVCSCIDSESAMSKKTFK